MTRSALLAVVVSTSLLSHSAFAHGGGGGGGHASGHPASVGGGHPHPHHQSGKSGGSSQASKASANAKVASLLPASRTGDRAGARDSHFAKDHPRRNEVNRRDREQLARIREGLKSGKLTPAEAKQLLSNDRAIRQQERAEVKANGGFLTKSQQRQINQEENANRRLIRDELHPVTPAKAVPVAGSRPGNPSGAPGSRFAEHHPRREEVDRRVGDQRARIAEGLKSGKLTPAQAKQLLASDKAIKQQEHADVKANGGFLTKSEQRQINQEETANRRLVRADEHAAAP